MIKIAHAYDDLLNLYGDYANIRVLYRYLSEAGYEVKQDSFSMGSYIDLSEYNLLYIGAGTEKRMLYALEDFRRFHNELSRFIENEGFVLATGNSIALLGKKVEDFEGTVREGAGLIDLSLKLLDKRNYSELILRSNLLKEPVIGCINSSMSIEANGEAMFTVLKESKGKRKFEGLIERNVYATELSGPILVRNPWLLHRFAEMLAEREIPFSEENWFMNAAEGYRNVLKSLTKELKWKE